MPSQSEFPLAQFLTLCQESFQSQKRLFEKVAEVCQQAFQLPQETVYRELLAREKLGSTAIGEGVAIPHCRIEDCREPVGLLITLSHPIEFSSPDSRDVDIFFVLLVPKEATDEHLKLLSFIATTLSEEATRGALRTATDAQQLASIVMDSRAP